MELGWEDWFGKRIKKCRAITQRQMGDSYGEPWTELTLEVNFILFSSF